MGSKQLHNLWLWRSFVKSEKISPDGGRVIIVRAWKNHVGDIKPIQQKEK